MQIHLRPPQWLKFILTPLILLISCCSGAWSLFYTSLKSNKYHSEWPLVHGPVIPMMKTVEINTVGSPPAEAAPRVMVGSLSIPLSTGWAVIWKHRTGTHGQNREIKLKKLGGNNGVETTVIIKYYNRHFEEPPSMAQFGIANWVNPFYHDTVQFLKAYPTMLSLFTAAAYATPAMLRHRWGLTRWRVDALLDLKLVLLPASLTSILKTKRLEAFILYTPQSRYPYPNRYSRSARALNTTMHQFRFGSVLFNMSGQIKLYSVRFRVVAASEKAALRYVVGLLSWASWGPRYPNHHELTKGTFRGN